MKIKRNRAALFLLDAFLTVIFYIPASLEKLSRKKTATPAKILIMELWGIGDLVIMSSILKPLKKRFPEAQITLLSKAFAKDIFHYNSVINRIIEFDFPWTRHKGKYSFWRWDWLELLKLIKRLRREKFDLVIDARGDMRDNFFSFIIGVKRRIGYNYTGGGVFLSDIARADYENQHKVQSWLNLLEYMGIEVKDSLPYCDIPEEEARWAEDFLKAKGARKGDLLIGVHPGAGAKVRCWPQERFARTAEYLRDKYKAKIIVFIEPNGYGSDLPIGGECLKVKLSLGEAIKIISRLDLLICNDGGMMHIANAIGIPLVAIYGPGFLNWFRPYAAGRAVIVKKDNFACSPCFDYCRHKESLCLMGITEQEVKEAVDKSLKLLGVKIPATN